MKNREDELRVCALDATTGKGKQSRTAAHQCHGLLALHSAVGADHPDVMLDTGKGAAYVGQGEAEMGELTVGDLSPAGTLGTTWGPRPMSDAERLWADLDIPARNSRCAFPGSAFGGQRG